MRQINPILLAQLQADFQAMKQIGSPLLQCQGMGVEMFGLSVSEANQIFNQRTDELPRLAFACGPWTVGEE